MPEIAYAEFETQAVICAELDKFAIGYRKVLTGVIADVNVGAEKTLAFRCDMDALPIVEANDCDYASKNGLMHACGHDAHMAIMLAFARYLSQNKDKLSCNVRLIFQPAEETEGGALRMIEAGCLEGVDEIYAIHVDPSVTGGSFSVASGAVMAGDVSFDVEFFGKDAHCAEKEKGKDAILCACSFVNDLSSAISKGDNILLHCGKISGGSARNVVSNYAKAECTMRYFSDALRQKVMNNLQFSLKFLNDSLGVSSKLTVKNQYIPVVNSIKCVEKVKNLVEKHNEQKPRFMAEDFAYYAQKTKGALVWLGVGGEKTTKLHSANFDFDEKHLEKGLRLFIDLLGE